MESNIGKESGSGWKKFQKTATRWATNHNWCYRGDNTKYKTKK